MNQITTAEQKKNASIENSVEKNKVRQDIIMQVKECMAYQKIKTATLLTLPAEHSYFEHGLVHAFNRANLKTNLNFYGVELAKKIVPKAFKNMPANSVLAGYCKLEDFLKYEANIQKSGFATLTNVQRVNPFMFDFGWFDYCGFATLENMSHFVNCINNNIRKGLIAVTFDLSTRHMSQKEYSKIFSGYKKGMNLHEAIVATLKKMIDGKANLVNETEYGGGTHGRTTMLTLVYSVNIPKGIITTINENFRDGKAEITYKRNNIYQKLKYNATHHMSKKARVMKIKKVKTITPEEIRVKAAVARWEKVWCMLSKVKKLRVATKYGKNLMQFSSMIAWHHGKLAA